MKTRTQLHKEIAHLAKENVALEEQVSGLERSLDSFIYSDEEADKWRKKSEMYEEMFLLHKPQQTRPLEKPQRPHRYNRRVR